MIRYNLFEYQVILFGLTNILAIFQDYINKILVEKPDIFVILYFDDIYIYIKSEKKEYMEAV